MCDVCVCAKMTTGRFRCCGLLFHSSTRTQSQFVNNIINWWHWLAVAGLPLLAPCICKSVACSDVCVCVCCLSPLVYAYNECALNAQTITYYIRICYYLMCICIWASSKSRAQFQRIVRCLLAFLCFVCANVRSFVPSPSLSPEP